ncbi:NAD(P)/FAD-dependent oxidoreductase [Halalkalibacter akibai]|uniref:Thioredoxin reductase n=1 Tax=Halalkalibacter akibai (strain ATCC 43226 / DSM 21942 / CIP 109018 / JCM 9157 / 1139) TaxID=1236973 RepID=W4QTZ6_HALA3|nr:NAD(P)/FAD-dependent oxidoreductase [Halalkalibacter akibai]GAE34804.1 thioredoxin reductase [Halalkalibacter akibai JCM 9157]
MKQRTVDVVVVGGGPGGLSAALVLGRSLRSVVVIDAGHPRNEVTHESHGFLTRDGIKPFELRELAHEQMKKYPKVSIIKDLVEDVWKVDDHFKTTTREGAIIYSRKLIFATGLKEDIPDIPGLDDVYGKSVFSCPYCDAYEHRDQPIALIGNKKELIHYIRLIYNWSRDLVVATNGPASLTEKEKEELRERKVRLVETPIKEVLFQDRDLHQLVFTDGETINRKAGFIVNTGAKQATMLPEKLGVHLNAQDGFETKEHGSTKVDGLFIIGDAAKRFTGLMGAASEGYETGVFMNKQFVEEDWINE